MSNMINWTDFEKIDMRVGTILEASIFEKAKKPAFILTIDFGKMGIKRSSAQITDLYSIESLPGQQIIAVVNFPSKQIANFHSECLVMGSVDNKGIVTLIQPTCRVDNGLRIG